MRSTGITTTTLILGGTGNTGRRLIEQLLAQNQNVRAIVRSKERFHKLVPENVRLSIIEGTVLDMNDTVLQDAVTGSDAVVSCLGHNMTFKGLWGKPRRLVKDSLERVCNVVKKNQESTDGDASNPSSNSKGNYPFKVILMGSNGVANPDGTDDIRPLSERVILAVLRVLVPPHTDNEAAAAYLSKDIGKGGSGKETIEWVVVRPDDLVEGNISKYEVLKKPRPGLFGAGQTTRANVAHFMSDLLLNNNTWKTWLYKMPVLNNV